MREIKFRMWDKRYNRFIDQDIVNGLRISSLNGSRPSHYELSQYTGVKDKNGIEIYEGDILHHGDRNITYTVVWHDSGWRGFSARQNGSYGCYDGLEAWQAGIVVIGNIYENPELAQRWK